MLVQVGPELQLNDDEREFLGPIDVAAIVVELEQPDTPQRRRALIGERLNVLGDLRAGVGIDPAGIPQIDWCAVPGGKVAIQVKLGRGEPRTAAARSRA